MVPCTPTAPPAVDPVEPVTPVPLVDDPATPVPLGEMPSTPVPVPFVLSIVPRTPTPLAPVAVWLPWMAGALLACAVRPLPFPVLVAVTAGLVVELVKDAGPASAAFATPPGSTSMAPTTPAAPAAAVRTIPRRVSTAGRAAPSAGSTSAGTRRPGSPPARWTLPQGVRSGLAVLPVAP